MRTVLLFASLASLATVALVWAQTPATPGANEKPWMDPKNCAFCKLFADQPGLLEHMHTEYYNLQDGIVSVLNIDKGYEPKFEAAQQNMKGVIADLQAGKQVPMCQHCQKIGEFAMKGVKMQDIKTAGGPIISLYQSSDTAQVKEIQDFGARSAAFAKAYQTQKPVQAK